MREMVSRKAAEKGVLAWDAKYQREVILRPYALFFPGDNPMQADHTSHAGLNCNFFCRTCMVGGSKAYKAGDEGFASIFEVSSNPTSRCAPAHQPYL